MLKNIFLALILMTVSLFPPVYSHGDPNNNRGTEENCRAMVANGQLRNGDRFTGRLDSSEDGDVEGAWYHLTPKGDQFHLRKVDWVVTPIIHNENKKNVPDFAKFGGRGTWNNIQGYTFRVHTRGRDPSSRRGYYEISIFGPDGRVFYDSAGYVADGDINSAGFYCSSVE